MSGRGRRRNCRDAGHRGRSGDSGGGSIGTISTGSGGGWLPATSVPSGPGALKVAISSDGHWVFRIDAATHDLSYAARDDHGNYSGFFQVPGLAGGSSVMQALDISDDNDSAGNVQILAIGMDHRLYHEIRYVQRGFSGWGMFNTTFQAKSAAIAVDRAEHRRGRCGSLSGILWHCLRGAGGWTPLAQPPGPNGAPDVSDAFERRCELQPLGRLCPVRCLSSYIGQQLLATTPWTTPVATSRRGPGTRGRS